MSKPIITRTEVHEFEYEIRDHNPVDFIYEPGSVYIGRGTALRIHTDIGVSGEYVTRGLAGAPMLSTTAPWVVGLNALEREKIYQSLKLWLKGRAWQGIGLIDIALWDLAGKYYDAPIYELLGGYRKKLPCYASTHVGDYIKGGLNSPEAFADFAQQCLEMGYPAFKIHEWRDVTPKQGIATIHAVGKRVGGKMDLMSDPANSYNTFADAVKVGRACDEEGFFWYEDPYQDCGHSQFAHRKLRQLIKTPLLLTEHVTSLEPKVDFVLADATDFLRGDPNDGGITGIMKLAGAAEALGIDLELHAAGPAHRQCMAAIRNSNYYEMFPVHPKLKTLSYSPPVYKSNYWDGLDAIDKDGCVTVPEGPGLGVEYDWDFIMKHRTGGAEYKEGSAIKNPRFGRIK